MPRTSTLIAKTHKGEWKMLGHPGMSLDELKKKFRSFKGSRSNPDFSFVQYQETDGHAVFIHLLTPEKGKAFEDQLAKDQAAAEAVGEQASNNQLEKLRAYEKERAKQHQSEIDRLNRIASGEVIKHVETPASLDGNGLRTDGPTPEEWVANGYALKNYPPEGFAAKPASVKQ
jgi:hypothetical protein